MFLAHICLFCAMLISIPSEAIPQSGSISDQNFCNTICEYATCPEGFTPIMNKCFKIVNKELNWEDSKNECLSLGGSLAIVNDCNFLNPLYIFLKYSTPNSKIIWIGASDIEEEGKWIWVDCTEVPMGVPFWTSTLFVIEPSGGVNENCAEIDPTTNYYFNDKNCSSLGTPLCQAEPLSVEDTGNCVCNDVKGECPDGFDAVGGLCYALPYDPKNSSFVTFYVAQDVCRNFYPGADLAILDDCNELRELVDFINNNEKYKTKDGYWLNAIRDIDEDMPLFYWGNNMALEVGPPFWGNFENSINPTTNLENNCTILYGPFEYYVYNIACSYGIGFPLCQVSPILQDSK